MASAYKHGVYVSEQETSLIAPVEGTAGLQVIFGTAPVNMLEKPAEAVNKPQLVYSYAEAVSAVGYVPWLLFTSPSPRGGLLARMPASAWKKKK